MLNSSLTSDVRKILSGWIFAWFMTQYGDWVCIIRTLCLFGITYFDVYYDWWLHMPMGHNSQGALHWSSQLWWSFHREANYAMPQIRQWMRPTHATWPNPSHPTPYIVLPFKLLLKTWPVQHLSLCPNQRVNWKAAFDIHLAQFQVSSNAMWPQ